MFLLSQLTYLDNLDRVKIINTIKLNSVPI